ncbi:Protein of unknown function (DUF3550/UPF0682) [Abeliophyllum distichum]|uniref:Uncharacterized protein n=1 Tax=Abeliophyllum distichum TaxID=126358 RepID=A0ABD1VXI4_9LAMI
MVTLQTVIRYNRLHIEFSLRIPYLTHRPLRYHAIFDSYPASLPYVARFNAKRLLKFHDALLTSYHKNEVKFAELTLDTYRMLQCLEWEPGGSLYQTHPIESRENGTPLADHSLTSGLIDMKLVAEMTDPNLPPNPKKAVLYRPSVTQLLNVSAEVLLIFTIL